MAMKCCTKLETAKERCPIVFQGHPSNFKVTRDKTSPILTQIGRFRTIGRSQLSNPSDLPCFLMGGNKVPSPCVFCDNSTGGQCPKNTCCMKRQSHERLWPPLLKLKFGNGWLTSNFCGSSCKNFNSEFQFQFQGFQFQFQFRNWNWNWVAIPIPELNWPQPCLSVCHTFLPEACMAIGYCRCLRLSVRLCVNHLLVRAITWDPFKLGLPNLDQRCKRPCLRSLKFWGAIDLDLQGQI